MKYAVQLTYPRTSRQPVYAETIEAQTKGEALLIAAGRAKLEGWKGQPIKQSATLAREVDGMSKHTPGPWKYRGCDGGWAIDFNADQEQVVDFVYEEADARLIAAAPDLLTALEEVMDCWLFGCAMPEKKSAIDQARAALAKARGEI